MVLIGCKTDLRKDKEQLRKLRAAQLEPITYMQVRKGSPTPISFNPYNPGARAVPIPSHRGETETPRDKVERDTTDPQRSQDPVPPAARDWRGRLCSRAGLP